MYECLLLPSFYVVYTSSSSRRSIQASLYFIIYTQIGSFIVVCVSLYIFYISSSVCFFDVSQIKFTAAERFFLYFFLFIGFGIKIPIWPFHYWLTKTHVEASAGFSMYLSGFLVKVAALGFYKFSLPLGGNINTSIFLAICIISIVDASLKLFSQTDLKKTVAYCTILEMNLIFLCVIWGNTNILLGSIYFIYTHAFLSSLMFFLVDCLQKRYNTRNVTSLCGVIHTTPNLGIAIFIMIVIFSGVPGSMKFVAEITIFSSLNQFSPFFCGFLILIVNFLGMIGFCKSWFNILFGMSTRFADANIVDLTIYEILVIFFCIFFLVFGTFFIFLF
jgi:NADH:ubiquinone oxidoreductase subunit 4 (subunit M)